MGEAVTVELMVSMHCKGCFRAVKKAISKLDGVTSYTVSFQDNRVIITGDITPEVVLKKIKKTGKTASLIPPPPPPPPPEPEEVPPPPQEQAPPVEEIAPAPQEDPAPAA